MENKISTGMWKTQSENPKAPRVKSGKFVIPQEFAGKEVELVIFKNENKQSDKHPDFSAVIQPPFVKKVEVTSAQNEL